jgi:large subunit ribosomal protein L15
VQQHELRSPSGARKARKRIGRGNASGTGTYAGKGMKGAQARSGPNPSPGFEGGQTPLIRKLPTKRGFRNPFRIEFVPVNVRDLARFPANSEVTVDTLRAAGLVGSKREQVKVLGDGELSVSLTVRVHRVSGPARQKIEAAGGTVEELTPTRTPEERRRNRKADRVKAEKAQRAAEGTKEEAPADAGAREEKNDSGRETSQNDSAE